MTLLRDLVTDNGLMRSESLSPSAAERFGDLLERRAAALEEIIVEFRSQMKVLDQDRGLNHVGRGDRMTELRRRLAAKIEDQRALPGIERLLAKDSPVPGRVRRPNGEGVDAQMAEVRAKFEQMDPLERADLLLRAAGAGESGRIVVAAIDTDPMLAVRELVPEVKMKEIRERFARAVNPTAFEERDVAQEIARTHAGNVAKAMQIVGGDVVMRDKVRTATG